MIVEKILRSMTPKFNYVVCSIEESNVTTMRIDDLQSSLARFEGRGRGSSRGRGRGRQSYTKALIECYKCHKLGHFQYECPSWEKGVNYAEFDEEEEMLLMTYVEGNSSKREDVWFLDSGCNNHMSGNKKWFSQLDEEFKHSVKLGNNMRMTVLGKGNIKLGSAWKGKH